MSCCGKDSETMMEPHPVACKMCIGCLTFWIIVGVLTFVWLRKS